MRLGQAVLEIFPLLSDPEIRVALVPLTEAEHESCLSFAAMLETPDNIAGHQMRDRAETREILSYAIRDPRNLSERIYSSGHEVGLDLEPQDVGFLIDHYYELADRNSPRLEQLPAEDVEILKKALQEMDWNEFTGRQWYAANRFLLSLSPKPLADSLLGSGSTSNLTTTSE